ncbi:MAG: hypothetical protein Q8P52_03005 [bacterium]|nr:hypothetical protein [bacterium]
MKIYTPNTRPKREIKIIPNFRRGFTFIETFVAITILLLLIGAPLSIAERGIITAVYSQDQVTAYYLSQEAVEFIRNLRDKNILDGKSWLSGLEGKCLASECGIDVTASDQGNEKQIFKCSESGKSCNLAFNPETGIYGHRSVNNQDWYASSFKRKVVVNELSIGKEAQIIVTMAWKTGTLEEKTFTITENIFSWK